MPPAWPRLRRNANDFARDLRAEFREMDARSLAPRAAAATFFFAGILALALQPIIGDYTALPIAIGSTVFGAVTFVLPWQRWSASAQLAMPGFAFVLFAWGGALALGPMGPYLAMLPLPFVFVGFTQRPGTSLLLGPVAALSLVIASRFTFDANLAATLFFALPMSVVVGEALAYAQLRRARAEARVERLLEAVRVLAGVGDTRTGAHLVAALSAELLGAEAVAVLLSDRTGSHRFLNRAYFGHPALATAAPLLVDALGEQGVVPDATTRFVVEPARLRALAPAAGCVRALAIVPLPSAGDVPIGVVIAMWTSARRRLPASARQSAELLSEEAGRMFQRLRDAAALAHDAETDPLTELANRRTFARALATVQPGDALVIVDLDHFKRVNDRHGHQVGDATLKSLAHCLRDTARQVDCVARYGGEEFALVLPEAGVAGATALLDRVRREWMAKRPMTTFSAGVAVHREGEQPRDALRRADEALYAAKEQGRNRDVVATFESAIETVSP
jgi:diguanylate cyclase (GGDEF)-like protein